MKILQINSVVNSGSTGKIVEQIGILLKNNGNESFIAYGRNQKESYSYTFRIGTNFQILINGLETRIFDNHAFGLKRSTIELISFIDKIKPDIIHIHNLHGYYINIFILFNYLKKINIPIIMTLHDCWTFTGHCAHFDFIGCEKWKTHCTNCPQIHTYPASLFIDRSYKNFDEKRKLFNSIEKLVIIPVSDWLNGLVMKSFLGSKKSIVIKNGIDLNIFKPSQSRERIAKEYDLKGNHIIIAVASVWSPRKGLSDILQIADSLGNDYSFIIIGARIKKSAIKLSNVKIIEKTENQERLAELYSAADLFINPTYEDTLPTTNIEALACGTPVLTYNTGGSPEIIDKDTGFVVEKGDIEGICNILKKFTIKDKAAMAQKCRKRAERYFNKDERFMDYIKLYEKVLKGEL